MNIIIEPITITIIPNQVDNVIFSCRISRAKIGAIKTPLSLPQLPHLEV